MGIPCARALTTVTMFYSCPSWYVGIAFRKRTSQHRFIADMTNFQLCTLVELNPMIMMMIVVAVSAPSYVSLFPSCSEYDENVF